VLELAPSDPWATLALARSQMVLGDMAKARELLVAIERGAPGSSAAAEAQAVRVVLDDPTLEAQLQSLMKAAQSAPVAALADIAVRARRLATLHALWPAWLASATADRRRGQLGAARSSLEAALEIAPGAAAAHADLAELLLEQGHATQAREHVRRAIELEGDNPRTVQLLSRVHDATGHPDEARREAARARAMDTEEGSAEDAPRARSSSRPPGWTQRLGAAFGAFRRKS
jgi:tetratricopeptide (TPR) repeat protein